MALIDKYKSRLSVCGLTERDRNLTYEKRDLLTNAPNSLSCKDVFIDEEERKLIIDSGTKPYYKQICSLPNETFIAGQYVIFNDMTWLILNADNDNEVYTDGNMQQCNLKLKWQNNANKIVEKQAVVLSASQYNTGEETTKTITLGYNQLMIYMPLDKDTVELKSDKRFFIDNNTIQPKTYKLTRVDTVTMSYQGIGCILLVVTEDQFNPDTDSIENWICDYIKVDNTETNTSPIEISYTGEPVVKIGRSKTFKVENSNSVEFSLTVPSIFTDKITLEQTSDNSCKVKVENDSILVGSTFKLTATGANNSTTELLIEIGGI